MPQPPSHQAVSDPSKEDTADGPLAGPDEARTKTRSRIIAAEQSAIDNAYRLLDEQRHSARHALAASLLNRGTGTPQSLTERDAIVSQQAARIRTLEAVEHQLVFGRIDRPHARSYIGRIGLRDSRRDSVVLDWRADAAAPFYAATAANPQGLLLRRRLRVVDRSVTDVHDDIVAPGHKERQDVLPDTADAAILAAAERPRTGRMADIVNTIQAEQDAAIRAPLAGILVVDGPPGTGKTVVALHRVAYLLHRHRDYLERHGVLIVGPGSKFLDYISHVLPGLGETSVTAATVQDLYPVREPLGDDTAQVAALKGSEEMMPVLRAAVDSQYRVPSAPIPLEVDGTTVWLRPDAVRAAQQRARDTGEPHNQARDQYCTAVLDDLIDQMRSLGEPVGGDARGRRLLSASPDVRREVNLCWMPRTPEQLLERLYADEGFRRDCTASWTSAQRVLLHRSRGRSWTLADIALLDHLAELLGPLPATSAEAAAAHEVDTDREELTAYASDTLRVANLDAMLTPEMLAARHAPSPSQTTTDDPVWDTFGHVVVDEAQDLSPMQWRMIARRCPSKSMTIVGDPHQTTSPAASKQWVPLNTSAAGRTRRHRLSVNYRVPGRVMDAAMQVLAAHLHVPENVRSLRPGTPPRYVECRGCDDATLVRRGADVAQRLARTSPGSVALVLPPGLDRTDETLTTEGGSHPPNVSLMSAAEVKGLEFDHMVLVEPHLLAHDQALRSRMLYICLTRATQTVTLVHRRLLPAELLTAGNRHTHFLDTPPSDDIYPPKA